MARDHRGPITGIRLAEELGVALHSLYRGIDIWVGRSAEIEEEAAFIAGSCEACAPGMDLGLVR